MVLIWLMVTAVLAVIGLALFAFWIWMLVSVIQNRGLSDGEKVAWVLVVLFLHFIGAIIYFFVGYPKRNVPLTVT